MSDETTTVEKATEAVSEASAEDVKSLGEQIGSLTGELESTRATIQEQREQAKDDLYGQEAILKAIGETGQGGSVGGEASPEVDYDAISQSQAVEKVLAEQKKQLDEAMSKLDAREQALEAKTKQREAAVDLKLNRMKYPDFDKNLEDKKYVERYVKVATENDKWVCEQIHRQLAMEDQYEETQQQKADEARKEKESLALTEKGGMPISAAKAKDLTAEEAGEMAMQMCHGNQEFIGSG